MTFKIAPTLTLSLSAVTETFAYFGSRGSGKTYAAGKTAEEFVAGGAQVVVVDPVGVWYGLRIAANGRDRGLNIPVFGGDHADVPLEPTAGELVARLVVEKRMSVVLDVSLFTLGQQHRFVTAFATALFNLKKSNRSPIHLFFDEAHEFLPQFVQGNEAEMVGAVRRLWKMGRNFGIGVSAISPRPAEVNKGALNLTERMFCGKMKGALDRKAMEGWAREQDADVSVLDELPRLKPGDLVCWTDEGTERVRVYPKKTFDASKTPEAGDVRPARELPKIDLDEVRAAMATTIEEARASDPKVLRARIAELERTRGAPVDHSEINAHWRAKVADKDAEIQALLAASAQRARVVVDLLEPVVAAAELHKRTTLKYAAADAPRQTITGPSAAELLTPEHRKRIQDWTSKRNQDQDQLAKCPRALLGVLAQRGVATASQVSILSGYRVTSTTFTNGLSALRVAGYITGSGKRLEMTQAGREAHGPVEQLPIGRDLLEHWLARLTKCEGALLVATYQAKEIDRAALAEATGYSLTSTTFTNGLSGLRVLELITSERGGPVKISEVFA